MEEKKPNFEIKEFKECPQCGCNRRVSYEVVLEEIEKGRMPKETVSYLYFHQSLIANQNMRWLSAPMLFTYYDVCVDCGTVYCIRIEYQTAVQGKDKLPRQPGMPFSLS